MNELTAEQLQEWRELAKYARGTMQAAGATLLCWQSPIGKVPPGLHAVLFVVLHELLPIEPGAEAHAANPLHESVPIGPVVNSHADLTLLHEAEPITPAAAQHAL